MKTERVTLRLYGCVAGGPERELIRMRVAVKNVGATWLPVKHVEKTITVKRLTILTRSTTTIPRSVRALGYRGGPLESRFDDRESTRGYIRTYHRGETITMMTPHRVVSFG